MRRTGADLSSPMISINGPVVSTAAICFVLILEHKILALYHWSQKLEISVNASPLTFDCERWGFFLELESLAALCGTCLDPVREWVTFSLTELLALSLANWLNCDTL